VTAVDSRTSVLVALLVYNGREFVPRALESLAAMRRATDAQGINVADVVVFDDASPDPGWSETLAGLCGSYAHGYYCSPRNLGIPRNMSLAMLHAEAANYDYVILLNSDVIVPANLVDSMVGAAEAAERKGARVASITAWSNNASIFSLPNDDADRFLADQFIVNQVAATLADEFNDDPLDLPVGMGFCLGIRVDAMRAIGVMDPVFGRGYCEEVDWCCRSTAAGWSHVLATNTFVFHMGSATTRLAGLLAPGEHTVQVNEAIIDERHPGYRRRVALWESWSGLPMAIDRAQWRLVADAAKERGYVLEATWLPKNYSIETAGLRDVVQVVVSPDGSGPLVQAHVDGFRVTIPVGHEGILQAVGDFLGIGPTEVRISDHGSVASQLEDAARRAGVRVERVVRYPERV
jgi:GT2 family glycosyltransferase